MTETTKPSKESIRGYLERRSRAAGPPPTAEEIRRQLGWTLLDAERIMRSKEFEER